MAPVSVSVSAQNVSILTMVSVVSVSVVSAILWSIGMGLWVSVLVSVSAKYQLSDSIKSVSLLAKYQLTNIIDIGIGKVSAS